MLGFICNLIQAKMPGLKTFSIKIAFTFRCACLSSPGSSNIWVDKKQIDKIKRRQSLMKLSTYNRKIFQLHTGHQILHHQRSLACHFGTLQAGIIPWSALCKSHASHDRFTGQFYRRRPQAHTGNKPSCSGLLYTHSAFSSLYSLSICTLYPEMP